MAGAFSGCQAFRIHRNRRVSANKVHKYASVIIDPMKGRVLYQVNEKKQAVYEFMEFVKDDWIRHVKAVARDRNSDYKEAFKDKDPEVKIIFDHCHIVKNSNDKEVSEVHKDEQERQISEGKTEAETLLKGSKYVFMATEWLLSPDANNTNLFFTAS